MSWSTKNWKQRLNSPLSLKSLSIWICVPGTRTSLIPRPCRRAMSCNNQDRSRIINTRWNSQSTTTTKLEGFNVPTHLKNALQSRPILKNLPRNHHHESAPAVPLNVRPRLPEPVHVRDVDPRLRIPGAALPLQPRPGALTRRPAMAPPRWMPPSGQEWWYPAIVQWRVLPESGTLGGWGDVGAVEGESWRKRVCVGRNLLGDRRCGHRRRGECVKGPLQCWEAENCRCWRERWAPSPLSSGPCFRRVHTRGPDIGWPCLDSGGQPWWPLLSHWHPNIP